VNNSNYGGMPGPGATTTQSFKEVLASTDLQAKLPGGVLLKQGFGVVEKGRVLGKITTSGKFAPCASTTLTANAATCATSLVVADSSAFVVGDTILVGAEAAASWVTHSVRLQNRIIRWLDIRFPEYTSVFKDWTCKRSLATLKEFPCPQDLESRSVGLVQTVAHSFYLGNEEKMDFIMTKTLI
jgi:hypothetical protein